MTGDGEGGGHIAGSIAVELSIDDPELDGHVRGLLLLRPGIHLVDAGNEAIADVRITDNGALRRDAGMPVIMLTRSPREAFEAGAAAVLQKHVDAKALLAAIGAALSGLVTLAPEFRDQLLDSGPYDALGEADDESAPIALTAREMQVLLLLVQGASNKTIARRLAVTPHTAKFHVASIIAKLGASGRTDAVAKAMRFGLVMI